MLVDQRPGLLGMPDHRRGVAWVADCGQGGRCRETDDGATAQIRYYISSLDKSANRLLEEKNALAKYADYFSWTSTTWTGTESQTSLMQAAAIRDVTRGIVPSAGM